MPTGASALAFAHTQLGKPYSLSSCRCSLSCWALDCSGLICASVNAAGLPFPCSSSFGIAAVVAHYGTQISEDEAIHTPGAIGIENPFGGSNFNGSNGHIVFFDGNGQTTTEEMGHRWGCCHGRATGRGFSLWAHFPGLDYSNTPAPSPIPSFELEQTMILQRHHYDAHGKPIPIPSKNAKGGYNFPSIAPSFDGKGVDLDGGSSLFGDQATGVAGHRRYIPDNLGSAKVVALAPWTPDDGTVPGVVLRYSDGRHHAVRFS